MVRLTEVRGLGTSRYTLPSGETVEQDDDAEIEQMIRGIRSACSWGGCREQSESGSRYCEKHDPSRESDPVELYVSPGGGVGRR